MQKVNKTKDLESIDEMEIKVGFIDTVMELFYISNLLMNRVFR